MPDEPPRTAADTDPVASEPTLTPAQELAFVATRAAAAAPGGVSTGQLPGRYQLGARLGAGGMGDVLIATDVQIGRDVAIKRMRIAPTPTAVARFMREAKVQGRLEHPAIVPVHELATDSNGQPFFVMKRLSGTTLADVLARPADPRFNRQKLLRAFADICLAVEFAHSRGVVHRDLKPANIMLGDFGEIYVLDWGIARVLAETDDPAHVSTARPVVADDGTTEAGAVLGTPGYIAPEVVRGEPAEPRADVYALGCILFEILASEPLWPPGTSALAAVDEPARPRPSQRSLEREVPPELDELCVEATRRDRADRVASARSLADRVEHYLDGDRDVALRRSLAATHLDAARDALAISDAEGQRARAMREAGRALALDPTGGEAAELVTRLMLEPPREPPREVVARLAEIDEASSRARAHLVLPMFVGFLAILPLVVWLGLRGVEGICAFAGVVALNVIVAWWLIRRPSEISVGSLYAAVAAGCVLNVVMARLFTPVLVAPGIAAVTVMVFASDARMSLRVLIVANVASVVLPWFAENLGWWSRTLTVVDGSLVAHPSEFMVQLPHAEIALVLYVIIVIGSGGLLVHRLAASQREALRSIELQAWHLRQLVPARD